MGLSRTGSEACLVYTVLGTGRRPIRRLRGPVLVRSLLGSESLTTGTVSRPGPAAARQTAQHTTRLPSASGRRGP